MLFYYISIISFSFGLIAAVVLKSVFHVFVLSHFVVAAVSLIAGLLRAKSKIFSFKSNNSRLARFSLRPIISGLIFLSVYLLFRNFDFSWDFSEKSIFSLSAKSKELLKKLPEKLEFKIIVPNANQDFVEIRELLNMYQQEAPNMISTTILDFNKQPELVSRYHITSGSKLLVNFGSGESYKYRTLSLVSEAKISSTISSFIEKPRLIYLAQGHGEPGLIGDTPESLSKLAALVSEYNIKLEPIFLSAISSIPDDADALMLLGANELYSEREVQMIDEYFENGGNGMLFYDPLHHSSVAEIALNFGVGIGRAVVLDPDSALHGAPEIGWQVMLKDFGAHPITQSLYGQKLAIFLISSPLSLVEEYNQNYRFTKLLKTAPAAWGERDLSILEVERPRAEFNSGIDIPGPLTLAVAVESKSGSRLTIFGNSQWVRNVNLDYYSHKNLILSTINWELAGVSSSWSQVDRQIKFSYMPISKKSYNFILTVSFILPELLLLFSCWLYINRERRSSPQTMRQQFT